MPVYGYRCENGHTFEVVQRMSDDPVTTCTVCGAAVQRVFHPVAVHFKGSGFYATDYGRRKGRGASDDGAGGDSDSGAKKESDGKAASSSGSGSGKSASSGSGSSGSGSSGSGSSGSGSSGSSGSGSSD